MIAIVAGLLTLFLAYLVLEAALHSANRRSLPVRIHVNGTRGKSSVTRLIAAGLRNGGIRTAAKTTGTLPRLIDEQGGETDIQRMGPANLIEQAQVFSWARRRGAEAIVIECMAVNPQLQEVAERNFVRSTIGVITNARPDHLDVMGPTVADVARSLCKTAPSRGILFTAESDSALLAIMRRLVEQRRSRFVVVPAPAEPGALLTGFHHVEHADNVAVALAVCEHLGVPRDVALAGMYAAAPDPGALRVSDRTVGGIELRFVNALAANDPASTLAIWQRVIGDDKHSDEHRRRVVLVNTRADRQHRSLQLADLLPALPADMYLLTGGGSTAVLRRAQEHGIPAERLVTLGEADTDVVLHSICQHAGARALVFAIGNVGGIGLSLAERLQEPMRVL